MRKPSIITQKGTVSLIEPGIMKLTLKENTEWTLEDAKETHKANLQLSKGERFCVLLNVTHFFIPSNDAQAYISSKECTDYLIASAFVVKILGMQLLGNLFLRAFKSKSSTRIFKNEDEALKWLRDLYKKAMMA